MAFIIILFDFHVNSFFQKFFINFETALSSMSFSQYFYCFKLLLTLDVYDHKFRLRSGLEFQFPV